MEHQFASIINILHAIRLRPGMYIGNDFNSLITFMSGFRCACAALGLFQNELVRDEVLSERGWIYKKSGKGYWDYIYEIKKNYDDTVNEVVLIEIDIWTKSAAHLMKPD